MPSMTANAQAFDRAFAPLSDDRIDKLARMIDRLEYKLFLAPLPFDDESEAYCANLRHQIEELEDELKVAVR